jgi:hypothetical protein
MAISFPSSPTVNQQSVQNGRTYYWTGYAWEIYAAPVATTSPSTATYSTVATTGSYTDLTNKPSIPTRGTIFALS